MYRIYVHIIDVTYVHFLNKCDVLPMFMRQTYRRYCKTRIYSCSMHL